MIDNKNLMSKEEEVIREVAEEENMSYEEVKEIWDTFKGIALTSKRKNIEIYKKKAKKKAKRKQARASRKRNR